MLIIFIYLFYCCHLNTVLLFYSLLLFIVVVFMSTRGLKEKLKKNQHQKIVNRICIRNVLTCRITSILCIA
jgi:hypothetical protein